MQSSNGETPEIPALPTDVTSCSALRSDERSRRKLDIGRSAMPKSQASKKSPAKGLDASKSNTKAGTPAPYEFSGRDSINISSFDLAQVQESLEHSDVPSMQPQLKSPRPCPRQLNHPMHWQLSQHEFLIARHKALRSSAPSHTSTLPALEPTSKTPETLPLDEPAGDSRPASPGESSSASMKPPLPEIRVSPPGELNEAPRQAPPPIEHPA
ncbi:uncharacterized protein FTJAE_2091, partial [Fusarium tjaetaba]